MRTYLILFLLVLASGFIHAEQLDQCKELNATTNLYDELFLCENNKEGKIDKLHVAYYHERTEEEYIKVQSYESITDLTIAISIYPLNSNAYFTSLTNLENLKNLENLTVHYGICLGTSYGKCLGYASVPIPQSSLKNLKSLKKLDIFGLELSQENIDEISTLENLESLVVSNCDFKGVIDFSSLNKLKKVTSLIYEGDPNLEFVKVFKSTVKELEVESIDSVVGFPNLEKLTINEELEDVNSLEKCKNLKELYMTYYNSYYADNDSRFSVFEKMPSLVKLTFFYSFNSNGAMTRYLQRSIDFKLSENSKIENMYLHGFNITEENINEILKLKNIKKMEIDDCTCKEELLDKLKEINGLCPLDISCDNELGYGYCFMYIDRDNTTTTTDIEIETTTTVDSDTIPTAIGDSDEKLPTTDDSDEKLPAIKDSDEKLPVMDDFDEILTDIYDSDEELTDTDDSDEELTDSDDSDDESATTTITITTTIKTTTTAKPTISGKCGEGYGKCKSGYCCSKYGWCGQSDEYCDISKGCQSEFGDCQSSKTTSFKVDNKHRCGAGIGSCPTGECCSEYGWCGKSVDHCSISEGCQSEYGLCINDKLV